MGQEIAAPMYFFVSTSEVCYITVYIVRADRRAGIPHMRSVGLILQAEAVVSLKEGQPLAGERQACTSLWVKLGCA